jgi:hypothetical protein
MDMNTYALEVIARDRLTEMRAHGERSTQVWAARPASRSLRVALGHALIRLGERLQGVRGYSLGDDTRGGQSHGVVRG